MDWFPALSEAVSEAVFRPTVVVAAAAETDPAAGPDVASVTLAVTNAPACPNGKVGMGEPQARLGAVASRLIVASTGPEEPPRLLAEHAYTVAAWSAVIDQSTQPEVCKRAG